ncbi:short-chain dehydrogenase [Streptomyces badius]
MTDGTDEYNASHYRVSFFYDLAKAAVNRMAFALGHELAPHGATAVALAPGWLRSEAMLQAHGVSRGHLARRRRARSVTSRSPSHPPTSAVARGRCPRRMIPSVARWNGRSLSSGQLAAGVRLHRCATGTGPSAWRYLAEVEGPRVSLPT